VKGVTTRRAGYKNLHRPTATGYGRGESYLAKRIVGKKVMGESENRSALSRGKKRTGFKKIGECSEQKNISKPAGKKNLVTN